MLQRKKKNMKALHWFILVVLLTSLTTQFSYGQKVYEFSELHQIPFIDEQNMHIIATTIVDLYKKVIKSPEEYSTEAATNYTVYQFYDTDGDGMLNRINPRVGEKYSSDKLTDLEQNRMLMFNLTFDEGGNLIVPEKIDVISYRDTEIDRTIKKIGLLAFELPVSDSTKQHMANLKLKITAAVNKNSLTGNLSPVKVQIPFHLSFGSERSVETSGTIEKMGDVIEIYINRGYYSQWDHDHEKEQKQQILDILQKNTDLMLYKKGKFSYVIEEKLYGYSIDVNIFRGMFVSDQATSFATSTFSVKSFNGQGKKLK